MTVATHAMTKQTVHLIGIGGIGMSGLARMYLAQGYSVRGSDVKHTEILSELEKLGVKVLIGHDSAYVNGADVVIYSSSIPENHPERAEARKKGMKMIHRSEALARICEGKVTIAVTGTHGKTTTTALVGMVLKEAGRDPSVVVGGLVKSFGGNAHVGKGPEIVIEADESDSSFLNFSPAMEIITNAEEEHMDHFKTKERMEAAYRDFLRRLPPDGEWFGCAEDEGVVRLAGEKIRPSVLYGFDCARCDFYATDIVECPKGRRGVSFAAWEGPRRLGRVEMKIVGRHNVLNALAAVGVGQRLGIPFETIAAALGKYEGASRRFDVKYEDDAFLVVDDYAHHPTEIQKTLEAAKALGKKRIVALFQPHRYSRTEAFLDAFGKSFVDADKLFVTDIYAASETPRPDVSGDRVFEAVQKAGHKDVTFVRRAELAASVSKAIKPGDLVIALGAGDIYEVAKELSDFLKKRVLHHFSGVQGRVIGGEPLSRHTTLKVGGPAEFWIEPEDTEDLKKVLAICQENRIPVTIFGSGSNILPSDEGLKGAVIHLAAPYFKKIWTEGGRIIARAGVPNSLFIQYALEQGFGGCEFLLGIPGCVGGAVAMNAGSHGQSIDAFLRTVSVMGLDGRERVLKKDEVPFSYRSSGIKDAVIVEGEFLLPGRPREEVLRLLDEYKEYRRRTQDLTHASAGCMFKNPLNSARSSGKLIEDAGLKGKRVGNAQVSEIHANFIINLGGATSGDVRYLMEEVRETVKKRFHVDLETEVKIL